jgi:Undecaprenyl-phosphate glucose phosphotransferase
MRPLEFQMGEPVRSASNPVGRRRIDLSASSQVMPAIDLLVIVTASLLAGSFYQMVVEGTIFNLRDVMGVGLHSGILFVLFAHSRGLYHFDHIAAVSTANQLRSIFFCWAMMFCGLATILFLLKAAENNSRGATLVFGAVSLAALMLVRLCGIGRVRQALQRGEGALRAVVICDEAEVPTLKRAKLKAIREVARVMLPRASEAKSDSAPLENAIARARQHRAEAIFLALPWSQRDRRARICERLSVLPLPILLLPDRTAGTLLSHPIRTFGSDAAVELSRAPLSFVELNAKRFFDVALCGLLVIPFFPIFVGICAAVRFSGNGPIFFRQQRKGFNDEQFTIYKFRTMTVQEDGPEIQQARRNDVRVTRVGRILRATSLDELPQLINVLRGEMSMVGPRPHAVSHDTMYTGLISTYAHRHRMKPGITGWAQINGLRGETETVEQMAKRVEHDLWYIANWSLWLDLAIVLRTGLAMLRCKNAY